MAISLDHDVDQYLSVRPGLVRLLIEHWVELNHQVGVGTLANGYIKSVPLPRVTARAAHVTAVTDRCQALTPVLYGLASVLLSSPMTKHRFSHESESFVQPLIMRQVACHISSLYLPSIQIQHTVLIN